MDAVDEAMKALKQVALKEKKDKGLVERVDSLAIILRLLDTSLSIGSQIFEKLVAAVRQPFIPLYEKFPLQGLKLSAAIFSFLFHEKIIMQLTAGNKVLQSSWEDVAESLLSGVLDFLEIHSDSARYLTDACFGPVPSSLSHMFFDGVLFKYYDGKHPTIHYSANEPVNKEMLQDPEYLGGRRLGATLYGSKDYVVLENLLLLVLIVAPKSEFLAKRSAFMREVFVTNHPEDTVCGDGLARILTKPTEKDSDLLQAQAINILAKSNLMFPQPFDVTQIDSCGLRFPQKPPQQRLIVDYKSLLANVIKDEGYESFRVSFDQICGITYSAVDRKSLIKVVVHTSSAPRIQSQPLKVPDGQSPSVTFEIMESDVLRFKRALRSRGIAGAPHISVSQKGHRLEFDREGNPVPDISVSVRKVQTIEWDMQLSQRSDNSPKDKDDQDREVHLLVNESPASPLVRSSRTLVGIPQEATAAISSDSMLPLSRAFPGSLGSHKTQTITKTVTTLPDANPADTTPRPRVPHQPPVFVPPTPSQNKILHKDVFGSGDTDLSEPSDGSEADSMKALSQKVATRTNSMIAITKRASILDAVSSAGVSGKKVTKRRVLDSGDEEVLLSARKGTKGGSKSGVGNAKKALPTVVVSDVEDDIPPAPAPLKAGRPKPTKKKPGPLDEKPGLLVGGNDNLKRKREDKDDDMEVGGVSDIQDKPPPVKRARKTAGGKPATTKLKADSPVPLLAPPRDSQVLKKARPAAKKNANYGGRTKPTRISSPARNSAVLPDDDAPPDTLELKARPVEPLVDDDDDDYAPSPPALPKSRPKPAVKARIALTEESLPLEKSEDATTGTGKKTRAGARTLAAATNRKVKDADGEKIVKTGPPQRAKAKAKGKQDVVLVDEGEGKGGEERRKVELTKDSPAVIEVLSSPLEPPKAVVPKRKPVSRVTAREDSVTGDLPKAEELTTVRPAPKRITPPQGEGDSRVEAVTVETVKVIAVLAPSPVRSASTEKRAKMATKPISEQAFATSVEREQGDQGSGSTENERQFMAELRSANDSRLVEANPPVTVGGVDHEADAEMEVEKEAAVTSVQGLQDMDVEPDRSDPIVAKSPVKTDGITKAPAVRVREPAGLKGLRPLEMNPDDGESSEDGIRGFMLPQPIMGRMSPVGISTPKERLETGVGRDVTAQSTPATLPRGQHQAGEMTFRKPRVTFATTPFKEKTVRSVRNETTPRNGAQRRTIFEGDVFGTNSAWKRTPAKSSDQHSALIKVLNEIQEVIMKKVTHQFEVAEEEAQFARNDVHNEALTDFKKMHSQRVVQFNALVDLETAYATREKELVVAYEGVLAVNTEILGHVRQKIREHDERNLVGKLPKTLGKSPISALMGSYLK